MSMVGDMCTGEVVMSGPARTMSKEEALDELVSLNDSGVILLEKGKEISPRQVSMDGLNPDTGEPEDGNVAGVVIRYLSTGTKAGQPSAGGAPNYLDPRNALALVRLCQWLRGNWAVTELYHLGIAGGGTTADGSPRTDCHGQGRAVDFVGVKVLLAGDEEYVLTVQDDWGSVSTVYTPGGNWPPNSGAPLSFRLDDPAADQFAAGFFRDVYAFIVGEWQDRTAGPDFADAPTSIGENTFVMNPDHPDSDPGGKHGREAHRNHIHMQIGKTGTE